LLFSRLTIEDWRQFRKIDIPIDPRLTVLTGANGTGKTTVLNVLSRHLDWPHRFVATPKMEIEVYGGPPSTKRRIGTVELSHTGPSDLIVADIEGSFDIPVPDEHRVFGVHVPSHRPVSRHEPITGLPLEMEELKQILSGYISQRKRHLYPAPPGNDMSGAKLKQFLISLAVFGPGNELIPRNELALKIFRGFEKVLEIVLPSTLGFTGLRVIPPELIITAKTGDFSLDAASGGVLAVIDIAYQAFLASIIDPTFVMTIDEPENHLHPEVQRTLLPNLLEAFERAQFIVATHSPLIVSSVEHAKVYVLAHGQDGTGVDSHLLDALANSGTANDLLRNVLGLTSTMPIWAEEKIQKVIAEITSRPLTKESMDRLKLTLSELGMAHLIPDALGRLMESLK
jgi:predicted ATPase